MAKGCAVRLSVKGEMLCAVCACGWQGSAPIRYGKECQTVAALVSEHLSADGLLLELAALIGPDRMKKPPKP